MRGVAYSESDTTANTAITSGQASIFSTAPSIIAALNKKDPSKALDIKIVMATALMGFGVAKENTALKDKLDALIRKDLKSGEFNRIFKKYHGADLPEEVVAQGA